MVLALALGRTEEELLHGSPVHLPISGRELARWKRFYRRHPFGDVRRDLQAGIVARAVYAGAGVKSRDMPALTDFVIRCEKPKAPKPVNRDRLAMLAHAMGVKTSGDINRQAGNHPHGERDGV